MHCNWKETKWNAAILMSFFLKKQKNRPIPALKEISAYQIKALGLFAQLMLACCVCCRPEWQNVCYSPPAAVSGNVRAPSFTSHRGWEQHRKINTKRLEFNPTWVTTPIWFLWTCVQVLQGLICKRLQVKFLHFMTCGDIIHWHYQWIGVESRSTDLESTDCFQCQT